MLALYYVTCLGTSASYMTLTADCLLTKKFDVGVLLFLVLFLDEKHFIQIYNFFLPFWFPSDFEKETKDF